MNKLSALEIKLVDNLFDKEAKNFLKETSYLQYRELMVFSFLPLFSKKKNSEMGGKMEQLKTRLQDSEHEVNLKLTAGREE